MTINSYPDALTYIYSYINYNPADTSHWSLERLQKLLARLDNPQRKFPSVLIAGTKGKGSTSAMCESILRQAGYKTGHYTSPHLHSFRERIRLAGELITETAVIELLKKLRPYFESTPELTIFELMTALAFVAFAEAEIKVAVLEVGLGGRLDATNAVDATVAVITSISYDHTQILGDTLSLIAREKAGIIRPGALVVSAPQVDEARQTIEAVCHERQAQLISVSQTWQWQIEQSTLEGQWFSTNLEPSNLYLPLLGEHQVVNAITAIAALSAFAQKTGLTVSTEAIKTGLAKVVWPGRWEILHHRPYLVLDSAMNGDSAEKLAQAMRQYFPEQKIILIFGASNDHPIADMLKILCPIAEQIIVVASRHPRAEQPDKLAKLVTEIGYQATIMPNVCSALTQVWEHIESDKVVCVTGSLFLVADARESWFCLNELPLPPLDPL